MATRDIKTRLVIEGVAEYKRKTSGTHSTLGLLKSALAKVESEHRNNVR